MKQLLAIALLLVSCTPKDEVVYIVTSQDKQAEVLIPEEALPRNIDILDISLEKTASGYKMVPEDIAFLGLVEFRSNNVDVIRVIDGDTVVVRMADGTEEHVRLVGIDATEKGDCYSVEATERLRAVLNNHAITLQINSRGDDRDPYGRLLRYVLADGQDIGSLLLEEGVVKNYPWFAHVKQEQYSLLSAEAKSKKHGLWGLCH